MPAPWLKPWNNASEEYFKKTEPDLDFSEQSACEALRVYVEGSDCWVHPQVGELPRQAPGLEVMKDEELLHV